MGGIKAGFGLWLALCSVLLANAACEGSADPIELGGMNLDAYCKSTGKQNSGVKDGHWSCLPGDERIDMDKACRFQFPGSASAFARQRSPDNVFSWTCYEPR